MPAPFTSPIPDPRLAALAWRAQARAPGGPVLATGWAALDAELPGGGWPLATLIELLLPRHGVGELSLLLPALSALAADPGERWLAWIGAPHQPYAPALAQAGIRAERLLLVSVAGLRERLWATEQALRSAGCAAVLAWLDAADDRALRRLKLAAARGGGLAVLFRPLGARTTASPATLRLALKPTPTGLCLEVVKRRGGGRLCLHDVLASA